jgi:hypothetical protein
MRNPFELLPLQFRVLYRQFLLRVIDLEALSIQADVVGYLGQFAGILIFYSLIQAVGALFFAPTPQTLHIMAWHTEHSSIEIMMLVVGLISVITWDATFPDRRDVMVLSPLPVASRTILFAKIAASASILALAILALNFASSFAWSLVLAGMPGALRFLPAWWLAMIAASAFLYGSILTLQGLAALLLPRRLFLRLSATLQLAAFALFLSAYFLEPSVLDPNLFSDPNNHWILASSPTYWFFALFNQLNGTLPPQLAWLAQRATIGLAVVVTGAAASLLLCYLHTMKKTVEQPDLIPGAGGSHRSPRFGSALQTAIVLFSFRSLTRSRQHRVVFAFYLSVVFAIALSLLASELSSTGHPPLREDFIIPTLVMMSLAVVGLRAVFALPISLTANWVLRTTQLSPSEKYIAATRRTMLLLAVVPVWLLSALLSLSLRPWHHVLAHLAVLALLGYIFAELSLINFYKVPFTCSYLPGKTNIQVAFFGFIFVFLILAISFAPFEVRSLNDPALFASTMGAFLTLAIALWLFNRHRARSAVLYFEELPEVLIQTLGLGAIRPSDADLPSGRISAAGE